MSVTAVLVNYHTAAMLQPLLDYLCGDPLVIKTVVVDNSGELHAEMGSGSERTRILTNSENRGFGTAVNQALAHAKGEWILVINPDIRLCRGCVKELVKAGEKCGGTLLGPRFYWDGQLQFRLPPATGGCLWLDAASNAAEKFALDRELFSFFWILRHQRFWEADAPFFEPFLTGACLLVRREWVASRCSKLFDERFFLYFEDTDLCAEALRDGIRPLCVPSAAAIHYWDQSPSPEKSKPDLMGMAHEAFMKKYYGTERSPLPAGAGAFEAPAVTDLGEQESPPAFPVDTAGGEESFFFEMGINPVFVPFAQALVEKNTFELPPAIWSRLGKGIYYCRVRGAFSGTKAVWKWKKK